VRLIALSRSSSASGKGSAVKRHSICRVSATATGALCSAISRAIACAAGSSASGA
jgi:hypothetical protein